MKIREELFEHPDWQKTNIAISDLNETDKEFKNRVAYLNYIEPNPNAIKENFYEREKFDYETTDEYRARRRAFYLSIDMDVDEKCQDGYYIDEENIKKDMLGSQLAFDKNWYQNYLNRTSKQ